MGEARRWVTSVVTDLSRDDLVECAELGVSELVTNALLHASEPISVGVRGTRDSVRIEVSDGSPDLLIREPIRDDDRLETFGRGLTIGAHCARAWGAAVDGRTKTVWFEPASEPIEDGVLPAGLLDLTPRAPDAPIPAQLARRVHLDDVPVAEVLSTRSHYRNLRRELSLLALVHGDKYPIARELAETWTEFFKVFPRAALEAADDAIVGQQQFFDIDTTVHKDAFVVIERLIAQLELADAFCRGEQLLTLARTPEQRAFQIWYLGEFARQARGEAPTRWQEHARVNGRR